MAELLSVEEYDVYDADQVVYKTGRRLSHVRNILRLDQMTVAKRARIAQPTVSKLEIAGYRRIDYLEAVLTLAKFYGLDPSLLMFGRYLPLSKTTLAVAQAFERTDPDTRNAVLKLLNLLK